MTETSYEDVSNDNAYRNKIGRYMLLKMHY